MKEREAARRYFGQPGFARFLRLLERQYSASRHGVRGYVTLSAVTDEERKTLDAFYQTYTPPAPDQTRRYSLQKFERLLRESRYALTVPELLALLRGAPVLTREQREAQTDARWRAMIEAALEQALPGWRLEPPGDDTSASGGSSPDEGESAKEGKPLYAGRPANDCVAPSACGSVSDVPSPPTVGSADARLAAWVRGLAAERVPGSRTLRLVFGQSPEQAQRCLRDCVRALRRLDEPGGARPVRLPVLAAEVTGDAHALDWKQPLGRLFWWGLEAVSGSGNRQPAIQVADTSGGAADWPAASPSSDATGVSASRASAADALDGQDAPDALDGQHAPDAPDGQDTPDAPGVPDTPDAPGVPDTPEVPDAPNVPDGGHRQALLIREGYRRGGVADDDLSSQVMLYAPELFGEWEERVLTLRQAERLVSGQLEGLTADRIFMVENPSVFAEVIDAARRLSGTGDRTKGRVALSQPVVVCGSGQPTTAVIRLLDGLLGASAARTLQYAGDLDAAGLGIANGLRYRYPAMYRAWRMDAATYRRYAAHGIPLGESECARLRASEAVWDVELVEAMLERRVKLHQELWSDELVQDVLRGMRRVE
ncbi:DUF2399 domain-containing protein [Paenibacillus sp. IB182496]|uniref:DUF2399 domain-containing protein n=1 Tax=Paenibacillus sabuli TaxID=2772509 RepID=A0A927BZL5_9BACL|nr:TIGR02679 domain-containing protein [Paenibacillus sabuli]MBD2848500.1 DUF2399 domain-containing protein [Paenibacillus sabuli]